MITEMQSSIFDSKAELLLCPVNCVGVMGKGLALSFKQKFPTLFYQYKQLCDKNLVRIGYVNIVSDSDKFIGLFPTKAHWKNPSQLSFIKSGLDDLRLKIDDFESIAIPALGCGLGQLNWQDVKPLLVGLSETLKNTKVELYPPLGSKQLI